MEPIKFLIVDDREENLLALEMLLRRDGLEVLRASSGAIALELLLVHDVALALIDVQMPDLDGFGLAELMRGSKRTMHIPIIFVTAGNRDRERVFKGYECGAVDFLFKPIEPLVLKGKADVFFDLYKQRRELSSALALNEMFVAAVGHDLRNPLCALVMGTQVLLARCSDPEHLETLRRMSSAATRMNTMIEQLVDLTRGRMTDGTAFRGNERVDLGELAIRVVDELSGTHPDKEISVVVHGDCSAPGGADRLLQLLSNLVSNALYHGAPGDVEIRVDEVQGEVVLSVHNMGAIRAEVLPTIFAPFRGKPSPSRKSPGLGLGLFICQQIASAHSGVLAVQSSEIAGTTFTVRLPNGRLQSTEAA